MPFDDQLHYCQQPLTPDGFSTLVHRLNGHPLPIKQLKGVEPVEAIDLSGKHLSVLSAIVIASLIGSNTATKSLKYVLAF